MAANANPYDIFSPHVHRDPDLYARMRNEDPIHCALHPDTGQAYWFLTRYEDCLNFLRDKRFGREFQHRLPPLLVDRWLPVDPEDFVNRHMLNLDEPTHARLKSLVHNAFMPLRINALRPRLQAIADQLFDEVDADVRGGDEFDLTERYITQLPLLTIAAMLGIPMADYQMLYGWTQTMLLTDQAVVRPILTDFSEYLFHQIDKRRMQPEKSDDLLSMLTSSEDSGDRLSRQELLAMVYLLITAGYETMVNFISNSIMTLFENSEQMRLMQENIHNSVLVKSAIEEMLRFNGPSHMTLASWAFEDVELGGKTIRQGDVVHAVLYAANRDPLVFENPDTFDILRSPNKHIAFSYGIHHCLGAALARLEGEIALVTLLRRMPNL